MNWILIGTLLGSIVTSQHDTREACEGRLVVLKEKGVAGECKQIQQQNYTVYNGSMMLCNGQTCSTR